MQSHLVPSNNGAESWTKRPALGERGNLGQLYDIREDKVIGTSILKTKSQLLPDNAVQPTTYNSFTYEATVSDSLEEKFSKLQIPLDCQASLLCGMLDGCVGARYLSDRSTDTRTARASIICLTKKKSEDLLIANDELKDHLDLEVLRTTGATHAICGIEWGAQAIITAETTIEHMDKTSELEANAGNKKLNDTDNSKEPARPSQKSILTRVLEAIGKVHVNGGVDWNSKIKKTASSFKFKIISDVGDPGVPRDINDVLRFLETLKSEIGALNDGKGVPIAFHLQPITDIANRFSITLQTQAIVQKLDEGCINGFVALLERHRTVTQDLEEYNTFLNRHRFCVSQEQLVLSSDRLEEARESEISLRTRLRKAVESVRGGGSADDLQSALRRSRSKDICPGYPSILSEYLEKIRFATLIKAKGAGYIPNSDAELDNVISSNSASDTFILFFNETTLHHGDWSENRRKLIELLDNMDGSYLVVAVDCDLGQCRQFEKPYIEQRRSVKTIVADVVEYCRELQEKCLVKCNDQTKVEREPSTKPPLASRTLRIPCPAKQCHALGKCLWICPDCRQHVSYGFTDPYLYCGCSRYLYSLAVFKCRNNCHNGGYIGYREHEYLAKLLNTLDTEERYNILILGETGVGKSMFVNAFCNYLEFESLEAAMLDPRKLRYLIPCSFTYEEKIKSQTVKRNIVVGEASRYETLSGGGESGTTEPQVYLFRFGSKTIRIIDTPGIGDTRGITQDEENMQQIIRAMESATFGKLSAVLVLLKPNESRLSTGFGFCMRELLRHLHRDVSRNMLFGFTYASGTEYTLGATERPLTSIMKNLETDITLGDRNKFFFDSAAFMYLAEYKLHGRRRQNRPPFDEAWKHSRNEIYRLLVTVMELDVDAHDVRKTLHMNKIWQFLEGLSRPLTEFTAEMKESQINVEKQKQNVEHLNLESECASEKLRNFRIAITVPIREKLQSSVVVCGHADCCQTHVSEDDSKLEYMTYGENCHNDCDLKAPEGVKGHERLRGCYAFRAWVTRGHPCYRCKHQYIDHVYVSSLYKRETRMVEDKKVLGELKSLKERKEAALSIVSSAQNSLDAMAQEETKIKSVRAQIAVYLKHNALVTVNDSTINYIDTCISLAQGKQSDYILRLQQQKNEHKDLVKNMVVDIEAGNAEQPNDQEIFQLIEELKDMKIFGEYLTNAIEQDSEPDDSRNEQAVRHVVAHSWSDDIKETWNNIKQQWPFG